MENLNKYYEILGVNPEASLKEIKEAYRDLIKIWHPDRFQNDKRVQQKAQEKLKEINTAYEIIIKYFPYRESKKSEKKLDENQTRTQTKCNQYKSEEILSFIREFWYLILIFIIGISIIIKNKDNIFSNNKIQRIPAGAIAFIYDSQNPTPKFKTIKAFYQRYEISNVIKDNYYAIFTTLEGKEIVFRSYAPIIYFLNLHKNELIELYYNEVYTAGDAVKMTGQKETAHIAELDRDLQIQQNLGMVFPGAPGWLASANAKNETINDWLKKNNLTALPDLEWLEKMYGPLK